MPVRVDWAIIVICYQEMPRDAHQTKICSTTEPTVKEARYASVQSPTMTSCRPQLGTHRAKGCTMLPSKYDQVK